MTGASHWIRDGGLMDSQVLPGVMMLKQLSGEFK
jgi:hypothetical protein